MWVVVGGGNHYDRMTKLTASAVVLGLALFGCAQSAEDSGSNPSGSGGSKGSGGSLGSADAASTGGSTGSGGSSASGGSTGSGGSSASGGSTGSGGSSASGGSTGSGGGSASGGSTGSGGSGGSGSGSGGSTGDAAAAGDGGYVWKGCLEPVYSSILPDEFCMVYEAVCGFGGTNQYKTKADCMMKFKGGPSDADACKSGHLCRASKDPSMRAMDCQTSAYSACKN
jgi:hypothetical protein